MRDAGMDWEKEELRHSLPKQDAYRREVQRIKKAFQR